AARAIAFWKPPLQDVTARVRAAVDVDRIASRAIVNCGNEWTLRDESLLLHWLRTLSLGRLGCNGRTYGRFRHRGETPQSCAQARKRGSLGPHGPAAQLEAHERDASG